MKFGPGRYAHMPVGNIMRRTADKFQDKTALIHKDNRITYGKLNERINRLANGLLEMGLKKGDRVSVVLHNCPEFIEIYFACAKAGTVFVPINTLFKQKEFSQIIKYIKPRMLIIDPDFEELISSLGEQIDSVEYLFSLQKGPSRRFSPLKEVIDRGGPEEPNVEILDEDLISIFLTSGTTGLPKGAMRTHGHNVLNTMAGAIELKLDYSDRAVLLFPLYHVTFEDHIRNFLMGNTVYIRREGSFDPKEILNILSEEKITVCQLVPTMINAMLQEKDIDKYDLTHLRIIPYAAAPMPVELLKKAIRRFRCQFLQMYGQTETGPLTTALKPEDHVLDGTPEQMTRLASIGKPVLHFETRIVDEDGNDTPVGEVGELIVRSESTTIGYWDLPEETAKTIKDGWVYTGDFCKYDEGGYIYIVDRKNDMIISGGKNIYPREIEEVLYQHEAVLEATVIGVPDDYWGESVKAVVVLKEEMTATEEEFINLCKENLASYKKPRTVEFRRELPKSPTVKILKRVIREEFWQGKNKIV
jgi:long-chain acyl-CoA synthetase